MCAMTTRPVVLYLCVHNAGRSQMAAAWTRHLAGDRVEVRSGGSRPAAAVNPVAVAAMREVGIDLGGARPQGWTEASLEDADVVVTMGCGDTCPVVPVTRHEDWPLADPAGQGIAAVRPIRDEIRRRVEALLLDLGVTVAP
jgi:arsenate reductase